MGERDEHDNEQPQLFEHNTPTQPEPGAPKPVEKAKTKKKKSAAKNKPTAKAALSQTAPPKREAPRKRTFPSLPLEEALKVAQVIKQNNNGRPWDTDLVARACGTPGKGDTFFYLTSAAQNYGLTVGSRNSPKIELTELGRSIVYASSADVEQQKKIEAFFTVEKFKQVYDFYNGSNLPEKQYLANALESEFQLAPAEHDKFTEVFKANCKYLGIEDGLGQLTSTNGLPEGAKAIDVRSMGKPKGEFQFTAFVAMPFSEKLRAADGKPARSTGFFDEVLKSVITPAGNAAGFAIETARREDSDIIHHTIVRQLLEADLVLADLTDHNPNVMFELGIRVAAKKPIVLIKSKDTGAIFDVDNVLRVYTYDQNLWPSTVQGDVKALAERISGTWENRENSVGYLQLMTTGPQAVR